MEKQISYDELLAQVSALKKQIKVLADTSEKLNAENEKLRKQNDWFLEQLKLSKKKMFGPSSEKVAEAYGQISLFNEAEAERTVLTPEPQIDEVVVEKHTRKKKRSYEEKYGNLPVEEIIYEPENKECEKCRSEMTFLKYESRKEIKVIPAKVTVIEYKKAIYVCKECDKNGIESNFISGEVPSALIKGSLVSPSFMAYIMNNKFCNGLPLYRQEKELNAMGIKLSRQTMANWVIAGANLLKPLYNEMKQQLLQENILHADETPLEVLREPGRDAVTQSYMWLYRTGAASAKNIVLYDYREGRSGDFAKNFLKGFKGYLHCDGWQGYNKVENIKRVGCWAHTRRYFKEAMDIEPKGIESLAQKGFEKIEALFMVDKEREKKSSPLIKEFFEWCVEKEPETLPKSLIGKAISYAINQKDTLTRYLENSDLEMTNNRAERSIKPFVIGRKNWLFCNTPGGATASARIYSIIETAKENGLKPYDYLNWLFEKIRNNHYDTTEELLPCSENIPIDIRTAK